MAKKQTRRSISVSRTTYERLKAFCETNNVSMSQLVETRVNDFLGTSDAPGALPMAAMVPATSPMAPRPMAPRPMAPRPAMPVPVPSRPVESRPAPVPAPASNPVAATHATGTSPPPMTSAAARFVVDPPPPIIKPRQDTAAPKPAEKRPEQIFTF
jgi:hypothetical protein